MTKLKTTDLCFQCGKPRIVTKVYKEYVNNSVVTTTESVCSDPICQQRTLAALSKEMERRSGSPGMTRGFGRNKNHAGRKPGKLSLATER